MGSGQFSVVSSKLAVKKGSGERPAERNAKSENGKMKNEPQAVPQKRSPREGPADLKIGHYTRKRNPRWRRKACLR
jgi:hypothetical protein